MKKIILYFGLILLITACQSSKTDGNNELPQSFLSPNIIELNSEFGYLINTVTTDSIKPIINSFGDTVLTGKTILTEKKEIEEINEPNHFFIPAKIVKHSTSISSSTTLTSELPHTKINPDSLIKRCITDNNTSFTLINSKGDTVVTNTPINITGHSIPYTQNKTVKAGQPIMKDNASYDIKLLDIEQGMPGSYICKIFHDSKGRLWIGTFDDGLSIYDGQTFTQIKGKEGSTDTGIKDIIEDKNGNLWFATYGEGAIKFDGNSFTHYNEDNGFINNNVESVFEDQQGNIWFGTYTGTSCFNGETFTNYTINEGLSHNVVWEITDDNKGNIWFATLGGGVNCFNGESFTHYKEKDGLANNMVWSMIKDNNGNLWFGTSNGLSYFDGTSFTNYNNINGLNNNYINAIFEDNAGDIWLGTYGGGVNILKNNSIQFITEKEGLSNNYIYSITQDLHGNMWFGTYGGGITKYNPNSFKHFTKNNGLKANVITSITQDKNGKIWLGSVNGDFQSFDSSYFSSYITGINPGMLISCMEDLNGDIWYGSSGSGVYIYKPNLNGFDHYSFKGNVRGGSIRSIIRDRNNNKWIGTWGVGLYIYNDTSFTALTEAEGLSNNFIWSLLEDSDGNIWIGTLNGLSKYNPATKELINYSEKEGLNGTQVLNIYEDKQGNIWLGTWAGLTKFDGINFTHYTEQNGLSNNRVWAIIEDNDGNLWVSTEKGLNVLKTDTLGTKIFTFDKPDGLKGSDFYINSVLLDPKNRIWWGNGKSLVQINAEDFYINNKPPVVKISNIDINEQFYSYRTTSSETGFDYDSVEIFHNLPKGLILDYDYNHLTFYFTSIDVASSHKIKYSYKINELSNTWSTPSHETKAEYRNLSYGNYTFSLTAIGEAQIWSIPIEYNFTISPPWWHTWWARVLYLLLLLIILFGFINWRTAKLKKRQKELETEVKNATKEIVAQKDEIIKQKDAVEHQKEIIEEAHKEITDSIVYAKRIQSAILPPLRIVKEYLKDSFILYKPKDVVAGDFYWLEHKDDKILFAAADCTGHGVPGAMVSVVCNNALNRTVREYGLSDPGEILTKTREIVIEEFAKSDEEVKDGMDIALCSIKGNQLEYAGAHNPLWIIRKGATEIEEIKADKQPIGKFDNPIPYTTHKVALNTGDSIYVFSDGYADQFGGEKGKKFKTANFKRLLLSIQHETMDKQLELIDNSFETWKGDLEQLDDVCVIALRF